MEAYLEASKKPQVEQSSVAPGIAYGNADSLQGSRKVSRHPWGLMSSDFPLVIFWTKRAWRKHEGGKKDSTELVAQSGQRGGARSAQGENVMMQFIQNDDGTTIDGTLAAEMREFARSLWRGFHSRNATPEKWGDTSKDIREEYYHQMENEFFPLRLCDNHWKSQAIATSIYSQWHGYYVVKKREGVKEEENSDNLPASKRLKLDPTPEPEPEPVSSPSSSHKDAAYMPKPIRPVDPLYGEYYILDSDRLNDVTAPTYSTLQIRLHLSSSTVCPRTFLSQQRTRAIPMVNQPHTRLTLRPLPQHCLPPSTPWYKTRRLLLAPPSHSPQISNFHWQSSPLVCNRPHLLTTPMRPNWQMRTSV